MREAAHYDPTTVLLGLKIPLPILLRADWPNGRRSDAMKPKHVVYLGMVAIAIALVWAGSVIPDLPKARYRVWVRGYGLVDSPKIDSQPGKQLNLRAVTAPDAATAAKYYPAIYWYTMMKIPPAQDFGGTTDIPKDVTQELWRRRMNNTDCIGCHQLGQESTRTIPAAFGQFKSGAEAWGRRVASGQTGELMLNRLAVQLGGVPFKYFGDWTDRVAKGALPKHKAPRPQGVER